MGIIVVFDVGAWQARYPEFAELSPLTAQAYFDEATIYHRNDGGGPVTDARMQLTLLNMMTAHIAALNALGPDGKAASSLVGRVTSASEGSVSVGATFDAPAAAQWLAQTKYGAAYWQATAPFRTMRYLPGPQVVFDPISPFFRRAWWW